MVNGQTHSIPNAINDYSAILTKNGYSTDLDKALHPRFGIGLTYLIDRDLVKRYFVTFKYCLFHNGNNILFDRPEELLHDDPGVIEFPKVIKRGRFHGNTLMVRTNHKRFKGSSTGGRVIQLNTKMLLIGSQLYAELQGGQLLRLKSEYGYLWLTIRKGTEKYIFKRIQTLEDGNCID